MITRNHLNVTILTELPDNYHSQRLSYWEENADFWVTYIDNEGNRRMLLHNIAKRVAEIAQNLPAKILDLGSGEGFFLRQCRNYMPNAELIGIDFSQSILGAAKKRSSAVPIKFSLGNFEDNDLKLDGEFDIITAIFTFDEASNLDNSFANLSKGLTSKGRAVVVILDPVLESLRYKDSTEADSNDGKSPYLMLISKHFYAKKGISPAPYYRIVRPITDYTDAAKRSGLDLISLKPISFGMASNEALIGPMANILIFGKKYLP